MANRVKEDEKNERIIRSLLKLTENRRCINCNSMGPQYVCTNFWTFVCTTCSGIHREFTHRVKSVSMAKFTAQEVSALQGGGNASAKEIYFKEWDPKRNSVPDSSNVERLRDFIKHVYVDRRYSGERSFDKPPRGEAEDPYENRRTDSYQGGSGSPPYEDSYECRYSDRPSPGARNDNRNNYDERSPGYARENQQYGEFRRSSAPTGIVNDWRREDRFGNERRSEDSRISDGGSKLEGRSPDHPKDLNISSPPMVRPVRDILGDNISPLRIIEPPKANVGRTINGSVHNQRTTSSSSLASSNGNPAELRRENPGILIDFDAVTEPAITAAVPQTQQTALVQSVPQPTTTSNADNWACFDSPVEVKVSQAPAPAQSLESVLSQLFVPVSAPGHIAAIHSGSGFQTTAPLGNMSVLPSISNSLVAPLGNMSASPFGSGAPAAASANYPMTFSPGGVPAAAPVGRMPVSPFGGGAPAAVPMNNLTTFSTGGAPAAAAPGSTLPVSSSNSFAKFADEGRWPATHPQQPSLFPATASQPIAQQFTLPVGASSNQPWNTSRASIPVAQSSQAVSKPSLDGASGVLTQLSPVEVKPSGRKELPSDIFAATHSPASVPAPEWQTSLPHGFGFAMQYNAAMPMSAFPQSSKSTNPFDLGNETSPIQASMFPSMASLQGALPNMAAPSGLLHASRFYTPSPAWMQPPSYPTAIPPQAPSYISAMPPSAYMGQQLPTYLPSRQQQVVGFSSLNSNQQLGGIYSAPATPNTFSSVEGNPSG